jgi:DNA-binding MarR family transcriptional regulator
MQEKSGTLISAVDALQQITRDLLGLAVRSVDDVGDVSLPQMRLLFALRDEGQSSCTALAHVLAVNASSITRLADRLVASGHVARTGDPSSRSRVLLALTAHGEEVIDAVLAWRSRELTGVLRSLDAEALGSLVESLDALHEGLRRRHHDLTGPVPL